MFFVCVGGRGMGRTQTPSMQGAPGVRFHVTKYPLGLPYVEGAAWEPFPGENPGTYDIIVLKHIVGTPGGMPPRPPTQTLRGGQTHCVI